MRRYKRKLLACGSAMRMHYLSVALLVEFANTDTAQKVHYQPDTNNQSDTTTLEELTMPACSMLSAQCEGHRWREYLLELVAGDDGGLGHVLEQRAHHVHTPVSPLLQYQDYSLNRETTSRWNSTLGCVHKL